MNLSRCIWRICSAVLLFAAVAGHLHAQASPTPTDEPEVLRTAAGTTEVGVLGRAEYSTLR